MARRRRPQRRTTKPKPKECIFCGAAGGLTEEHVFPKWLRKLGLTGEGWREVLDESANPPRRTEIGSPFNKRTKVVCADCNNGWMSGLEDAVKPHLLRMFSGEQNVALDAATQLTLACWAFKTMCILGQLGRYKVVPVSHCRELYSTRLPPRQVQLWIGTASAAPHPNGVELAQSRLIPRRADVDTPAGRFPVTVYQGRFRLLNVFFDAFGYESDLFEMDQSFDGELARALLPVWPSRHPHIFWPPAQTLDALGGIDGLAAIPMKTIPTMLVPPAKP